MHHHPQPEKIEFTSDEFNKIESEIKACNLRPKTKELILKAWRFYVWLQGSLEHANTVLKKAKSYLISFQGEKEKRRLKNKLHLLIFKLLLTLLRLHLAVKT